MDQMVEDLDGVEVIMDDVIIAGEETTHDEGLMKFQEKASKKGHREVLYVGHLLTAGGLKIDPQKV